MSCLDPSTQSRHIPEGQRILVRARESYDLDLNGSFTIRLHAAGGMLEGPRTDIGIDMLVDLQRVHGEMGIRLFQPEIVERTRCRRSLGRVMDDLECPACVLSASARDGLLLSKWAVGHAPGLLQGCGGCGGSGGSGMEAM